MNLMTMAGISTQTVIWIVAICVIVAVLIIGAWLSIRIVPQSSALVVQRLGKYRKTLQTGFNMILPIFDRTLPTITLKEQVLDFRPTEVITKDNIKMLVDTIIFAQVVDPKLYTYGMEHPIRAVENLTATTLRNIIGDMDLDETLTSREVVNAKMREVIDLATDPWGIKVHRVELKNILPPASIQESMEKQMRAERERRESILRAEGEKRSNILVAEGEKESAILRATGEKEAAILRAEAKKISLTVEAEGQAKAIDLITKASPDAAYLTLQGFEAVKQMADGQATKIIVPNDFSNVAGLFTAIGETLSSTKTQAKTNAKVITQTQEKK